MVTINASDPGEGVAVATLFVAVILLYWITRLRRTRPGFAIGKAMAVAYALRLLSIVAINATGLGASLRGGDETTFLLWAQDLAGNSLGRGFLPHGKFQLQTVLFALQLKLGFMNISAIRVTQVGIALLGFVFMLAATYDLAGPKAARLAAWCLAFEPASIFFSTEIHKEALLELAAGLCAFGGVWLWQRLDLRGILICGLGCLIAIETRSYAGWFLVCGCVLLLVHAAIRNSSRRGISISLIYAVIVAGMLAAPTLLSATSGSNLQRLQQSQAANATGTGQGGTGSANGSNLALEQVNLSSRSAVITSLPKKIRELLLEPYPWRLQDSSQAFGALGTLVAYTLLLLVLRYAWLCRGRIFGRAGPLLYPLLFEMVAYAVTVGNAGTGFRYRTHLVTLGICAVAILRESAREHKRALTAGADGAVAGSRSGLVLHPVTA